MGAAVTLGPEYFDALYSDAADPWGIEQGWYEERKRGVVLAALPRRRYARAFEPGCASGALSVGLAERCDELVCWDPAERAVEATRARLADRPGVRVERGALPERAPPSPVASWSGCPSPSTGTRTVSPWRSTCLLYTSDAADD